MEVIHQVKVKAPNNCGGFIHSMADLIHEDDGTYLLRKYMVSKRKVSYRNSYGKFTPVHHKGLHVTGGFFERFFTLQEAEQAWTTMLNKFKVKGKISYVRNPTYIPYK